MKRILKNISALRKKSEGADLHSLMRKMNQLYYTRLNILQENPEGIDILAQDWDNLIILDACRYDVFEQLLGGDELFNRIEKVESSGGATPEFLRANFKGADLQDTIYVTSNSYFVRLQNQLDTTFFEVVHTDHAKLGSVTNRATELEQEHENKKIIAHFLPPHTPYRGELAEKRLPQYSEQQGILQEIRKGNVNVSDEELEEIYRQNLRIVFPEVRKLCDELHGKTVVTADHGELLGHRVGPVPLNVYGHFSGLYHPDMVEVPWAVVEGDKRKEVLSESPKKERVELENDVAEKRLQELGYL